MENNTVSTRTQGLLPLFDIHSNYFERALDGIPEDDRQKRLNTPANHIAWLAGSLVNQRFLMASEMEPGIKQQGAALFENHSSIKNDVEYPTIAQYINDWKQITPFARKALVTIDDAKLDSPFNMGGMTISYLELITFNCYREASIIGQLALWRRLLGHPGMRYD